MDYTPTNDFSMAIPLQQKSSALQSPEQVKKKRKAHKVPWKKPKDMPKRPLSAYNLFFAHEREQLLRIKEESKKGSVLKPDTVSSSKDLEKKDSNELRPHQKSSGIGFANLAKTIASKWKTIDPALRAKFEAQAKKEKDRYTQLMVAWREKKRLETKTSGNKPETQAKVLETPKTFPTHNPSPVQITNIPTPSPEMVEFKRRSLSLTLERIQDTIAQIAMPGRASALIQSREALRKHTEALRLQFDKPQPITDQRAPFDPPHWNNSFDSVLPESFHEDTLHLSEPLNWQSGQEEKHGASSVFQASLYKLGSSLDDDTIDFLTNLEFDGLSSFE